MNSTPRRYPDGRINSRNTREHPIFQRPPHEINQRLATRLPPEISTHVCDGVVTTESRLIEHFNYDYDYDQKMKRETIMVTMISTRDGKLETKVKTFITTTTYAVLGRRLEKTKTTTIDNKTHIADNGQVISEKGETFTSIETKTRTMQPGETIDNEWTLF